MIKKIICAVLSLCISMCAVSAAGVSAGASAEAFPKFEQIDKDAEVIDYLMTTLTDINNPDSYYIFCRFPKFYLTMSDQAKSQIKQIDRFFEWCKHWETYNNCPEEVAKAIIELENSETKDGIYDRLVTRTSINYLALDAEEREQIEHFDVLKSAAEYSVNKYSLYIKGDLNFDGGALFEDSRLILDYVVHKTNLITKQIELGDMDNNGIITANDALIIYKKARELFSKPVFPLMAIIPVDEDAEALDYMLENAKENDTYNIGIMSLIYLSLSDEAAGQVKNFDKLIEYCRFSAENDFPDKATAESVFEMIDSFPDKSENMYVFESAVSEAGICYFALTEEQRNAVSNFDKLKSAAGQLSNSSGFWLYGDANLDGAVNTTDALHTLQCAVKLRNFNTKQKKLCDIDEDGMITVTDALKVLLYACRIPGPTLPRK